MDVFLASHNPHKYEEFRALLPSSWKLKMATEANESWDCVETALYFAENALLKARSLSFYVPHDAWVLADDSGLCVDALDGKPGIYSARYGQEKFGRELSQKEKNLLLLKELVQVEQRQASFVCSIALLKGTQESYLATGILRGEILHQEQGENGFGYDPLFYLPDEAQTLSSLSFQKKNTLSHRGLAVKKILYLWEATQK